MVDALCRAARWVKPPPGCVIDLRPANVVADVEIGCVDGNVLSAGGLVVRDQRRARHAAADAALHTTLDRGLLTVVDEEEFSFYRYPDSISELRDYIATKWQDTELDASTCARADHLQRANAGSRLWLREQVMIRRLSPKRVEPSKPETRRLNAEKN
jgi:hypothetical protein